MYTDGERWITGYVRPDPQDQQVMIFGRSEEFTANVKAPYFNAEKCGELFRRIVGLLKLAVNSNPRNSLSSISHDMSNMRLMLQNSMLIKPLFRPSEKLCHWGLIDACEICL